MKVRINVTISPDTLERLDEMAKEVSRTRSGMLERILTQVWSEWKMATAQGSRLTATVVEKKDGGQDQVERRPPGTAGAAEFFKADPVTEVTEGDET